MCQFMYYGSYLNRIVQTVIVIDIVSEKDESPLIAPCLGIAVSEDGCKVENLTFDGVSANFIEIRPGKYV